jgi:hypothetical protein
LQGFAERAAYHAKMRAEYQRACYLYALGFGCVGAVLIGVSHGLRRCTLHKVVLLHDRPRSPERL